MSFRTPCEETSSKLVEGWLLYCFLCEFPPWHPTADVLIPSRYICSRFFLHTPIDGESALHEREDAPEEMKKAAAELKEEEPEVNLWVCLITLLITVALTAVTAEFVRITYYFPYRGS